ncbi:MAG: hypothetical protein AAFR23_08945, partial [Pseudomonadota bacterium]
MPPNCQPQPLVGHGFVAAAMLPMGRDLDARKVLGDAPHAQGRGAISLIGLAEDEAKPRRTHTIAHPSDGCSLHYYGQQYLKHPTWLRRTSWPYAPRRAMFVLFMF